MEARDYVLSIRSRGLTQGQVAQKTGIPQPTISKIERGEVSDVMSRNYRALQALHEHLMHHSIVVDGESEGATECAEQTSHTANICQPAPTSRTATDASTTEVLRHLQLSGGAVLTHSGSAS